jgi:hypothetical protein
VSQPIGHPNCIAEAHSWAFVLTPQCPPQSSLSPHSVVPLVNTSAMQLSAIQSTKLRRTTVDYPRRLREPRGATMNPWCPTKIGANVVGFLNREGWQWAVMLK